MNTFSSSSYHRRLLRSAQRLSGPVPSLSGHLSKSSASRQLGINKKKTFATFKQVCKRKKLVSSKTAKVLESI